MIKQKGTERRKDDRLELNDASHFVLGWNNREKLIAIGAELKGLEAQILELGREMTALDDEKASLNRRIGAAEKIALFYNSYAEIDWETLAKEIADLETERTKLKSGSDRLKQLENEKATTKTDLRWRRRTTRRSLARLRS